MTRHPETHDEHDTEFSGSDGGVLVVLLVQVSAASAGVFRGPYDFSVGPYRGGQGWSYAESYGYFGVPSTSEYPYLRLLPLHDLHPLWLWPYRQPLRLSTATAFTMA